MNEKREMRYSNFWSRLVLILDFIICVIYTLDPFEFNIENHRGDFGVFAPAVIIGLWFFSTSLKSNVYFKGPTSEKGKKDLRISYYFSGISAAFIIIGSSTIFLLNWKIAQIAGIFSVVTGLILQIAADRYFRPFLSEI